jgi:hypothetical protein
MQQKILSEHLMQGISRLAGASLRPYTSITSGVWSRTKLRRVRVVHPPILYGKEFME